MSSNVPIDPTTVGVVQFALAGSELFHGHLRLRRNIPNRGEHRRGIQFLDGKFRRGFSPHPQLTWCNHGAFAMGFVFFVPVPLVPPKILGYSADKAFIAVGDDVKRRWLIDGNFQRQDKHRRYTDPLARISVDGNAAPQVVIRLHARRAARCGAWWLANQLHFYSG
jgi:hypothetical protein